MAASGQWAITDEIGVIAVGTEEDMRAEFADCSDFAGDLLLVEVKEVRR